MLAWMGVIFYLSHQPVDESNKLSQSIADATVQLVEEVSPATAIQLDRNLLNHFARKGAHVLAYLVLGFLVLNALICTETQGKKAIGVALLICVLYAITDEIHQTFVPGRGGEVSDVLLDALGAAVGVTLRTKVGRKNPLLWRTNM